MDFNQALISVYVKPGRRSDSFRESEGAGVGVPPIFYFPGQALSASKFRRQHPIGPYIADFCCVEAGLVVELDGSGHHDSAVYDAERTEYFGTQGYNVVRFWNSEVLQQIEVVVEKIARALERQRGGHERRLR